MTMRRTLVGAFACLVALAAIGCMPKMTVEDFKAMRPQRPQELEMLNAFVGKWQHTGTLKMSMFEDEVKTSGSNEAKWGGDGWYLVDSGTFGMGEMGEMKATSLWAYDAKAKKFRTAWVDSMGGFGTGTVRYNKKTDTWHMTARSQTPHGTMYGKGTTKFVSDDEAEWTWSESALFGLIKVMDMKGTTKRQ